MLGAAILFVHSLVIPTTVLADGGPGNTNCGNVICKP